nr:hypothetical protein Iba_chr14eCG11330 [Ipomoea batatas]GME20489.1 hypothetical protein Iba_scaffold25261CG0030 [Ipomoea batatas]
MAWCLIMIYWHLIPSQVVPKVTQTCFQMLIVLGRLLMKSRNC